MVLQSINMVIISRDHIVNYENQLWKQTWETTKKSRLLYTEKLQTNKNKEQIKDLFLFLLTQKRQETNSTKRANYEEITLHAQAIFQINTFQKLV